MLQGIWDEGRYRTETAEEVDRRMSAELRRLRDAFTHHRTATHEVRPSFCVTCKQSDQAIAAATRALGE